MHATQNPNPSDDTGVTMGTRKAQVFIRMSSVNCITCLPMHVMEH